MESQISLHDSFYGFQEHKQRFRVVFIQLDNFFFFLPIQLLIQSNHLRKGVVQLIIICRAVAFLARKTEIKAPKHNPEVRHNEDKLLQMLFLPSLSFNSLTG